MKDFSFVCSGMINFNHINDKKLKFKDGIFSEDHLFGILLFSQAKNIYIYPKIFYYYRIRANSSTNQDKIIIKDNILPHFRNILDAFNGDAFLAKEYFRYSSWVLIALELINFISSYQDKTISLFLKK
ncbi:glycosyltransferase family 2 protein, partial [Campylobacter lari]